jgi:H+/gluconate symporter-like permease
MKPSRIASAIVAALLAACATAHAWPAYDDSAPSPVHSDILLAQLDASASSATTFTTLPPWPAPTIAAPAPSWQAELLMAVVGFVGLVLAGLATPVAYYLARKFHIDAKVVEAAHVDDLAERAVHYAEEQSNKAIAANLPPKAGQEKMELAVKFVTDKIAEAGLAQKGADSIKALVESKIGETKAAVVS